MSYFINNLIKNYYKERKITHYIGPISHLSLTSLLERVVQGLITYLRTKCIKRNIIDDWSLYLQESLLFANTKNTKVHKYILAKIILGFTLPTYPF